MIYFILDCGLSFFKRLKKYPQINTNEFVAGAETKLDKVWANIFIYKRFTIIQFPLL